MFLVYFAGLPPALSDEGLDDRLATDETGTARNVVNSRGVRTRSTRPHAIINLIISVKV